MFCPFCAEALELTITGLMCGPGRLHFSNEVQEEIAAAYASSGLAASSDSRPQPIHWRCVRCREPMSTLPGPEPFAFCDQCGFYLSPRALQLLAAGVHAND